MKRHSFIIIVLLCVMLFHAWAEGYSRSSIPAPDDTLYTATWSNKGFNYFVQGDLEAALECYRKVCEAAPHLCDTVHWGTALSSMGAIYRRRHMPDSSLICYQAALRLAEASHNDTEQANILSNIALHYMANQQPILAMQSGEQAVDKARRSGEMEAIMFASYAGSSAYFKNKEYTSGIRILQSLVNEAKHRDMPQYMLKGYRILLQMFDRRGLRDSVNYYLTRVDSALNAMPEFTREAAMALEQQAIIYTKYHNFNKSLEVHEKLLQHNGGGRLTTDKIYLGMAHNYYGLRDYLHAMKYYDRAVKTADSIYKSRLARQADDFDHLLDEKDQALIESSHREQALREEIHSLHRKLYAAIGVAGLMMAGFLRVFCEHRFSRHK